MQKNDYLKNGAGDVLAPIQNTEGHALFQVIGNNADFGKADLRFKDIYFIGSVEADGHLTGGNYWEEAGRYVKGKKQALMLFESLNPDTVNKNQYYDKLLK